MLWTLMLFAVGACGVFGFFDTLYGFGDIMRSINSGILILLSFGLLIRTWMMTKLQRMEKLTERNAELERQLEQMKNTGTKKEKEVATSTFD
jgi:hypothetical protein